jgi:hypothetical protein
MTSKDQLPKGWLLSTLGEVSIRVVDGSHNPLLC